MAIKVKEVPIKVYNSIRKVEWYYTPLRRVYKIISLELEDASKELTLQMAVKAINNSAGLDRLVPTLLVFSAYP
jgi:membrane protein YdbS with pleckstrin-like domain